MGTEKEFTLRAGNYRSMTTGDQLANSRLNVMDVISEQSFPGPVMYRDGHGSKLWGGALRT